jgi:RNA-splicing ligase RtcB
MNKQAIPLPGKSLSQFLSILSTKQALLFLVTYNYREMSAGKRRNKRLPKVEWLKLYSTYLEKVDHFEYKTAGVECRKDEDVIDETPGCYKDIDAVMAAQSDLVEVVHTLKQILCVKG